jgi:hypothetical protein
VTRLYLHRGFWGRYIGLLVFLGLVFVYGCFELWRAWHVPSRDTSTGVMFGVIFAGGSLYALRQVLEENRDLVVTLARDAVADTLAAAVFARVNTTPVTAPTAAFTNWRLHRKTIGRNRIAYFIHVDCTGWPRPLRFDLKPGTDLAGLRQLAPAVVAEFDAAIAPVAKS